MNRLFQLLSIILFTAAFIFNTAYGDVFELKNGAGTVEGKIVKEDESRITVKLKTTGTCTFPKALVKSVKKEEISEDELYTKEDIYHLKVKGLDPKDAEAHLALANWCLKNGSDQDSLFRMALAHFRAAKALNPGIAERAGKELLDAENKEAGKSYSIAETAFKAGDYLKAEKLILSVLSVYPDTEYAKKAKELMIKIWGRDLAVKVLDEKDSLPDVSFSPEEIYAALSQLNTDERKERYFVKCINKAGDFEERAKDVDSRRKQGYYIYAINCYDPVFYSDRPELKDQARSKAQALIKDFFEDTPAPSDNLDYMVITNYLNRINEKDMVEKVSSGYFKAGEGLYKKAKRSKRPEKAEKAKAAYFCFLIANNFSKDEKMKREAFNYMVESQGLERTLK